MLIMKTLKKQEIFKCIINQFYLQLKKKIRNTDCMPRIIRNGKRRFYNRSIKI